MNTSMTRRLMALVAAGALTLAACGDNDTSEDAAAFCDLVAEAGEKALSAEDFAAMIDSAPGDIVGEVEAVADAFDERGKAAFGEVEVVERVQTIEAWAADNCEGQESADGSTGEADPDAQQVDVVATEYAFEFDAPEAGPVSFVMDNQGEEPHMMMVARLADGVTAEDALASPDPVTEGLVDVLGESDPATPGEDAVLAIDGLEAGNYLMVCLIPDEAGTPHVELGMVEEFSVS